VRQIAGGTVTVQAALLQTSQSIHHLYAPYLRGKATADIGRPLTGRAWHHSLKEGKNERQSRD
jgi:hypothetical protein